MGDRRKVTFSIVLFCGRWLDARFVPESPLGIRLVWRVLGVSVGENRRRPFITSLWDAHLARSSIKFGLRLLFCLDAAAHGLLFSP
jgi:hypothetical protein